MQRSKWLLVLLLSCANAGYSETLAPVFKVGKPSPHTFREKVYGYGALAADQRSVAIYIPGSDTAAIKTGATAKVDFFPTGSTRISRRGHVTSIIKDADPKTKQAIVSIAVPAVNAPARTFARVTISTATRRSLTLPPTAVLIVAGKVFVLKELRPGNFEPVPVTIGSIDPSAAEILAGLKASDSVLIEGGLEWLHKSEAGGD